MKKLAYISLFLFGWVLFSCQDRVMTSKTVMIKIDGMNTSEKDLSLLTNVFLDIQGVQVHGSDDGWVSLPTHTGSYDLFYLEDNAAMVLVDQTSVPIGKVSQLRLVLGPHNFIIIDGIIYALKVPSGQESGLKINIDQSIGHYEGIIITLNFDPNNSIVEEGNGEYLLKPVIRLDMIYLL